MATVLEGFETGPLGGTLTWDKTYEDGSGNTCTITSSSSHATEGTKTWNVTGTLSTSNFPGAETSSPVDLSSYTSLSLDFYVTTCTGTGAGVGMGLVNAGATNGNYSQSSANPSGALTLSFDLTSLDDPALDLTAVYISFYSGLVSGTGSVDYNVDKLSAVGAGGSFQAAWARNSNTVITGGGTQ